MLKRFSQLIKPFYIATVRSGSSAEQSCTNLPSRIAIWSTSHTFRIKSSQKTLSIFRNSVRPNGDRGPWSPWRKIIDLNSNAISVESRDHNGCPTPRLFVLICALNNSYGCEVHIAVETQNSRFADESWRLAVAPQATTKICGVMGE